MCKYNQRMKVEIPKHIKYLRNILGNPTLEERNNIIYNLDKTSKNIALLTRVLEDHKKRRRLLVRSLD